MAIITLNRKIFEKEIGKLDAKMQNKIAMFGTTLESFDDDEIELEIFPNRPDLLSYQGFKRSFLGFLEKNTGLKKYNLNKPEKEYKLLVENSVADIWPYAVCAIVKGLKLNEEKIKELIDIQEKLTLTVGRKRKKLGLGIYPLDKIKLPIIYRAVEPDKIRFVPLGSEKEMSGLEILQKHVTGKEYAHLLAGKAKFPIFVDAGENILSMPPIINSNETGRITETTKDVFVECTGKDFELLKKCLNIIVTTLAEMGGEIYQMELKQKGKDILPNLDCEKMKISLENTNKLLGLNLNEKELKKLFEKMGYNYSKGVVEIPAWRTDILHEVDLIEDVAIAYGYENFEPILPEVSTIGQENKREIIKRKISEILTGIKMLEVSNYHLTNKNDQFIKMGITEKNEKNFVEMNNSKTDYTILRKDLTPYLLKIFSENVDSEYPQEIFETGRVFNFDSEVHESENLAVAVSPGNFTEIKQILEYLAKMTGLVIEFKEPAESPVHFIDGRVAEIYLNNKKIGFLGEIHPKILRNWKIKMPIALFEISLEGVFEKLK